MQIEEESLPQAWGRLLRLHNALPDHPLKKNEILDIFYNGLTDASRDYLDSCAGSVFRERTPDEAEILLNNMLTNENNWTLPEPTPKPTPKKRGILFLSPEDMQEAKKSMKEKGIKAEDVKNLPPIEEIHGLNLPPVEEMHNFNPPPIEETHGLDNPTQVVEVILSIDLMKVIFLIISLLVNAWMSSIILLLNKKTSMLMLVDN